MITVFRFPEPCRQSADRCNSSVLGAAFGLGVHQFAAKYSGDSNNSASLSSTLTEVVTGTTFVTVQANTGGDHHYLNVTIGVQ